MRDALHTYGLFAGFGLFTVAGWMTLAGFSGGVIAGAGPSANVSVTGPLAIACLIMTIHCVLRLWREDREQ